MQFFCRFFVLILTACLTFYTFVTMVQLMINNNFKQCNNNNNNNQLKVVPKASSISHTTTTTATTYASSSTTSTADVLVPEKSMLIFNRVPKTGSTNLALLIKRLSRINGFQHVRFGNPDLRLISVQEQIELVKRMMSWQRPFSYDRHVYFIDFTRFLGFQPYWIRYFLFFFFSRNFCPS